MKYHAVCMYALSGMMIALSLCSCVTTRKYYEVVEFRLASPDSTPNMVQNNDIKISFNAWNQGGLFTFRIYNKTDSNLLINWQISSLIIDSVARNYNGNGSVTVNTSTTMYNRNNKAYNSSYGNSRYNTVKTDQSIHYENPPDVTLLPSKSYIESSVYKVGKSFHNPADVINTNRYPYLYL